MDYLNTVMPCQEAIDISPVRYAPYSVLRFVPYEDMLLISCTNLDAFPAVVYAAAPKLAALALFLTPASLPLLLPFPGVAGSNGFRLLTS